MSIVKTASARYEALGKKGKGFVSTESKVLNDQPYGFNTRFEDKAGTNPEELIAAAHASCYTMALSFMLEGEGYKEGKLHTTAKVSLDKDGDGFKVSKSALSLQAHVDGIEEKKFKELAEKAKTGCPISKLMTADITLSVEFNK